MLKRVRRSLRLKDVPVVMLTSKHDTQIMTQAMAEGVVAYIFKDQTNPEDLRRQIEQIPVSNIN